MLCAYTFSIPGISITFGIVSHLSAQRMKVHKELNKLTNGRKRKFLVSYETFNKTFMSSDDIVTLCHSGVPVSFII